MFVRLPVFYCLMPYSRTKVEPAYSQYADSVHMQELHMQIHIHIISPLVWNVNRYPCNSRAVRNH